MLGSCTPTSTGTEPGRRRRSNAAGSRWKPNVLVFSGSPQLRWYLIELTQALAGSSSSLTVAVVVPLVDWAPGRAQKLETSLVDHLRKRGITALAKVYQDDEPLDGIKRLVKGYGFGPLTLNIIVLGETERMENVYSFCEVIGMIHRLGRNLVLVRQEQARRVVAAHPRIDVWWRGEQENIELILVLTGERMDFDSVIAER